MYLSSFLKILILWALIIQGPFVSRVYANANLNSSVNEIAAKPQWIELLRYRADTFWGYTSEQDGQKFFFAKDGKTNPENELAKFVEALKQPFNGDKHPVCRFPARYQYVRKHLKNIKRFDLNRCVEYTKYKNKLRPTAVSVEFSSYYMNKPASAFGHTLLRFSKRGFDKQGRQYELLDNGLNYAALVTTTNPLAYGVMGIFGGFAGNYTSMPYFYKVREYNDFESRDIWIYELNMTQAQIDFLVAHSWEMSQSMFRYFYFDENCSYHILALLNAVNPEWDLVSRTQNFVVPINTVKVIDRTPGLLKKVHFRPSNFKKFNASVAAMNDAEKEKLHELIDNGFAEINQDDLSKLSWAKTLDAAIDYIDYQYAQEVLLEKSEISQKKTRVLLARAKTGMKTTTPEIDGYSEPQPHKGHGSRKASISYIDNSEYGSAYQLEYRFTFHNILDRPDGYNPTSTVEMGRTRLQLIPDEIRGTKIYLDEFSIARILNLNPVTEFDRNLSFKFNLSMERLYDDACENCMNYGFDVGAGASVQWGPSTWYMFYSASLQHSASYRDYVRTPHGPEAGILWGITDSLRMQLNARYERVEFIDEFDENHNIQADLQWNWSNSASTHVNYEKTRFFEATTLTQNIYF